MRVCLVFFVCVVLVASAIARPGGKRARRNQPVYEDEIDDRGSREQSHKEFLDDFFNGKPLRQNYGRSGLVTKNVAKSWESDEEDDRGNSESDEDDRGNSESDEDDSYEDSEEEDQDGQSEEETGGYDDNQIDDSSRGQSEGRKRPPPPYVPHVQEAEEYDDIDNDVSEQGRRPSPPYYERPVGRPRQYDEYDQGIQRNRESQVQGQRTLYRSDGCAIYCSSPNIGGSNYARIRSVCGCGDHQMQYKK